MIFDAHADILTDIYEERKKGMSDVFKNKHLKNFKAGKVRGGILVIWIDPYGTDDSRYELIETLKNVSTELIENKELFKIIKKKNQLKLNDKDKRMQIVLGIEGLKCIEDDLELLDVLYRCGIRHVSLTWNEENKLGTGVDGDELRGLTAHGIAAVEKLEKLGVIIDVSHANEKTFWDIIRYSKKPLIASHSNSKTICDHKRNLNDLQLKAIRDRGGIIGINVHKNFVDKSKDNQNIERFIDHLDHIVDVVGIDHVGFGFDFCEYLGDEDTNIESLKNISNAQNIISALKKRGYKDSDIEKISYKNFERIINQLL